MTNNEATTANLTRRAAFGIFARAASAIGVGTVATTGAVHAIPITAPPPAEHPALLEMGERLGPLLAAYRTARAEWVRTRAIAEANWPQVPDEILVKGAAWFGVTEQECDIDNKIIIQPGPRPPQRFLSSYAARKAIERGDLSGDRRTRFGKELWKKITAAERYEAEREAVLTDSGYEAAKTNVEDCASQVQRLGWEMNDADIVPCTIAGLRGLATLLLACNEVASHTCWSKDPGSSLFASGLAAGLLAVAP